MKIKSSEWTDKEYQRLKVIQKINNFTANHFFWPVYIKNFGIKRSIELWKVRNSRLDWLDKCSQFIQEDFSGLIEKYKKIDANLINKEQNATHNKYVWVCWLQGEANMPEIVSLCLNSIKENVPKDVNVVLITMENMGFYIDVPEYIYIKLRKGTLSLTHFSDIVRFSLLQKYGGLWMDATIYVSSKISDKCFNMSLYGIQNTDIDGRKENPYYGGITSYLVGGSKEFLLFGFCKDFFLEYQKKYNRIIDVHWINIAYEIAYKNFLGVELAIDNIGMNNVNVQSLVNVINQEFNEQDWDLLTHDQVFHKMNWRINYKKQIDGKITFYGYILNNQTNK